MKYIALLRGINVGGRRKILMADLKKLFQELGFLEVQTYIQSGNVLFVAVEKEGNNGRFEDQIAVAITQKYGFEVPVIVRNLVEWTAMIAENPFVEGSEVERLHLTFLKEKPTDDRREKLEKEAFLPDKFKITNEHIFVFCAGKYSSSKLTNHFFERKLKVATTTRNWKTVLKILNLGVDN